MCLEIGNASKSYTKTAASSILCGVAIFSYFNKLLPDIISL